MNSLTKLSSLIDSEIQTQEQTDRLMEMLRTASAAIPKSVYYTRGEPSLVPKTFTAEPSPFRWSDYSVEPTKLVTTSSIGYDGSPNVYDTIRSNQTVAIDPMKVQLDLMEAKMAALETRMIEATNKANQMSSENADLRAKVQSAEHMQSALMFRISQLEQKGYSEVVKQVEDRTAYNDMIRRIEKMERDSYMTKPYWGSDQITCTEPSPASWPSTIGDKIVWPAARSATSSLTWDEISGMQSSIGISASDVAMSSFKAAGRSTLGEIDDYNMLYNNVTTGAKSK